MSRTTTCARTLVAALTIAMSLAVGAAAFAQEGNTYKTMLTVLGAGTVDLCVTFSETAPGVMTIIDPEGETVMAIWGHWVKKAKWFLATANQRGQVFGLTGKKVGAKKIKGEIVFRDDDELLQGTFVGRRDDNCTVTRHR